MLGLAANFYIPILNGDILPDPWETLFDWGGEVIAMTYLSVLINTVNMAPYCFVAGLLDRCRPWQTVAFVFALMIVFCLAWPGSFLWPLNLICGLLIFSALAVVYLVGHLIGGMIWKNNLPRLRPATASMET